MRNQDSGSSGVGKSSEAGIRQVLESSGNGSHQNSQNHLQGNKQQTNDFNFRVVK
jgi:hypothetical protein